MASSIASDRPELPAPLADNDPFISNASTGLTHLRFSNFDRDLFAAGPGSSPRQAKRALEAHLAETDRRLDEAGKLGTALVSQRKALAQQLHEVEKLQTEAELDPSLRQKLVDMEKDYNDLARESARAFLPKPRAPSNETNQSSPYRAESRSGRRSVSPSKFEKFESQATGSPTKLSVPNRKTRHQPSSRVHDIEFAAEISTSLIAQVRNLQALLAEREDQVKDLRNDVSRLEADSEAFQQHLKILDESEHLFKEENWNLQTRLQEMTAQQREASDREKKLAHSLHAANAAKASTQKELDEVKLSHSKLAEEHAAATKHHDIELGTAKRTMAMAEGQRAAMQRKMDDLTNQNQELAKAVSAQRARAQDREPVSGVGDDDLDTAAGNVTPDHSPPPSPVKGTTPRHSMLETETLKTSLQHAQRTIQSQRSQLHREKTEKLELRRIVQDLRDDLEKARNDVDKGGALIPRRGRRVESKEIKAKPPRLLGSFRSSRQEIVMMDEPDWEDAHDALSSATRVGPKPRQVQQVPMRESIEPSDHFETANEASESAFETANERATETDDFQTGNEGLSDSDVATETESISRGFGRMKRPPSLQPSLARRSFREDSFDSTASTSADEDEIHHFGTPSAVAAQKRYRTSRGPHSRGSRQASEEPGFEASPAAASFTNVNTTAHQHAGQSLFAELQDFGGSDNESVVYTPGRRSARSMTPGSTRRAFSPPPAVPEMPQVIMVDSAVMTDPVLFAAEEEDLGNGGPRAPLLSLAEVVSRRPIWMEPIEEPDFRAATFWHGADETGASRPLSTFSYSDAGAQYDIGEELALFPAPPTSTPHMHPLKPPRLNLSLIQSEHVEPRAGHRELPSPLALTMAPIIVQDVEPLAMPEPGISVPPPSLSLSSIAAEGLEPRGEPEMAPPALSFSHVAAEDLEPRAQPAAPFPALRLSALYAEDLEPRAELEIPAPALALSAIVAESLEPGEELEIQSLILGPSARMASPPILSKAIDPVATPDSPGVAPTRLAAPIDPFIPEPEFGMWSISTQNIEPVSEPEVMPSLVYSLIAAENVEPAFGLAPVPPTFAFSSAWMEHALPTAEAPPAPPALVLSPVSVEHVELVSPPPEASAIPRFAFSSIESINTRPITPRSPKRDGLVLPRHMEPPFGNRLTPGISSSYDYFLPFVGRSKGRDVSSIAAEDETRQFRELFTNANAGPVRRRPGRASDQSAQTALTAAAIDRLLRLSSRPRNRGSSVSTTNTTGTIRIYRSLESLDSSGPVHSGSKIDAVAALEFMPPRRPSSAISARSSLADAPPLPSNHRQVIQAVVRSGSAGGPQPAAQSNMGPPLWPASAMRNGPFTPNQHSAISPASKNGRGTPTPRAARGGSTYGNVEFQSPARTAAMSRQSSVSSFASELDTRFNMGANGPGVDPAGFGPNTDPRMIQAITQTMIGEHLWKYTRKPGRGELSEKRHRRYFWVHPYTRTLYWSDRDPSTAGRTASRAKSVPIEAVRVVTDDNPMPPGLHRKSLVILSPGRTIKFTCATGQRHETWFNALSYLLLRTSNGSQMDAEELAENIAREDVDEFNPQYGRRPAHDTRPPAPSLSSYNSRTTRNGSHADRISMDVPTLTPSARRAANKPSVGSLSKLGGYLRSGGPKLSGTLSNMRGRAPSAQNVPIYEASEVHDSAEDVREMIERQDRESDRLENVRACCDGKHDVGTLPHMPRRIRSYHPSQQQQGHSALSTASMRSRA